VKDSILRKRWSLLSILITLSNAVVIYALIHYLYGHGLWTANARARSVMSVWGGLAFFSSLVTAIVALVKDKSKAYAIVALCLSLFSFVFYAQ